RRPDPPCHSPQSRTRAPSPDGDGARGARAGHLPERTLTESVSVRTGSCLFALARRAAAAPARVPRVVAIAPMVAIQEPTSPPTTGATASAETPTPAATPPTAVTAS